jgi:RNA polymerase sigma factor (sigma-70 family)
MIQLTKRHLNIPWAVSRRMARGDRELADEMCSAGCLALVRAARRYDPKKCFDAEPGGWLHHNVVCACLAVWTARARGDHFGIDARKSKFRNCKFFQAGTGRGWPLAGREPDPADAAERRDLGEVLFSKLTAGDREIVTLRLLGRKYAEIGAALGLSDEGARQRYRKALAELRRGRTAAQLADEGKES